MNSHARFAQDAKTQRFEVKSIRSFPPLREAPSPFHTMTDTNQKQLSQNLRSIADQRRRAAGRSCFPFSFIHE